MTDYENEIVSRCAPRWAWDVIDETLSMDAMSTAFSSELRKGINRAINAVVLASELADDHPIGEDDPRIAMEA